MKTKSALVTGGCGFVGRHLVLRLLQHGCRVWIVDNLLSGKHPDLWLPKDYREKPDQVTFIQADVRVFFRDYFASQASTIPQLRPEPPIFGDVFHLAAVIGGRAKIEGEPMAVAQDLSIDADFFAWACKARPERVLYASSSAAYPIDLQQERRALALREEFLQFGGQLGQPDMTYGWAKLTGEYLASIAAKYYELHVACVRPFSGYGEDQDETYPVPAIAGRVARREDPLYVWGAGLQGRDFVHIEDCIDTILIAIDKVSDGSAVNIGSGKLTTFIEVAQIFSRIAGYSPQILAMPDKPTGVHSRYADISRAKAILGWQSKITLEEGFRRVYEVARQRAEGH